MIMTKKRKKRKRNSEIIGSEEENGSKTKDILNNKTSKESDKMFVTMQVLGISIENMANIKELEMSESTINRNGDN